MPVTTKPNAAVEIIAHRGASFDAPENTLAAVHLAWRQNADAVEIDVHLSQDGHIIVMHDAHTTRTAGLDKLICGQTLQELKSLDAGCWMSAQFAGERIPVLDEVLAVLPAGKRLFIEIKCGLEIIPALHASLATFQSLKPQIVIAAFSLATVTEVKEQWPEIEAAWLVALSIDADSGRILPSAEELILHAQAAGIDGLDLGHNPPIDATFIAQIHAANLKCYAWTIDSPDEALRLTAAGIDGITTNRPAYLLQSLS